MCAKFGRSDGRVERGGGTDRQTDRHTDIHTDIHTYRQTDKGTLQLYIVDSHADVSYSFGVT